jgi:S-sulfo-L-cysteine synthase (O-acetyl-L-serine-dependent)
MEMPEAEVLTAVLPCRAIRAQPEAEKAVPDVIRQIGRTPLIRLQRIAKFIPETVSVYAKGEHLNPSGSVKDRAARCMVLEGLHSGALGPGKTLIDATSGNTGIAYAMLGAAFGFPVTLAMPANASPERKHILEIYGAELILTDPMEGTDGAQDEVRRLVDEDPDRFFYPDQYNNDANWQAHYNGTGKEILEQTRGRVTHFVAGLGTTGTFTGVARRLKEYDRSIRCYGLQPDSPLHALEGLKHLETAKVPGIFDPSLVDEDVRCSTEDAYAMARRLAREEGLFVGPSSAANVVVALKVAQEIEEGTVVTILCDTGARYLSDSFWNETES